MHLDKLIVQRRVGDRSEMENRVELFVAELLSPIERREILRDKISAIAGEILEIARSEIVDHGQMGFGKLFLQGEDEIRSNESGAAGDKQVE